MRIAREAEKGWQDIIPQLEEGALVKNMPLGASQGDFERADLYMKYGFGPVQENGLQFGQVLDGKIVPISPTIPMNDYVTHLADRAKSGGEDELFGQLNDNAQALRKLTSDVKVMRDKNAVSGLDYDNDYYDDYDYDYEPEITIDDLRTREENVQNLQRGFEDGLLDGGRIDAFDPIELRRNAKRSQSPDVLVNDVEAATSDNIAQLRDAQMVLNQNVRPNPAMDVLEAASPRRLPQMIAPGQTEPPAPTRPGIRNSQARSRKYASDEPRCSSNCTSCTYAFRCTTRITI